VQSAVLLVEGGNGGIGERKGSSTLLSESFQLFPLSISISTSKLNVYKACTGSEVEMVTPGGEVAFVKRIISESLKLCDQVQWYTSMLGKSQSVPTVIETLKSAGITNWAVTQFVQGNKTRRWAIAWSFGDLRPRMVRFER
jgi:23S rRNA (adenine1618-N6)-methyltransferase